MVFNKEGEHFLNARNDFTSAKHNMFKNLEIMNLHAKRMVLKTYDLPQKPEFSMKVFFFGVRLDHGASGRDPIPPTTTRLRLTLQLRSNLMLRPS